MNRTIDHLEHIVDAIRLIRNYVTDDVDPVLKRGIIQSAVLRELQTMSESCGHLPDDLHRRHPAVPWRKIGGFRNRLTHAYLGLDMDAVVEVVENELDLIESMAMTELARLDPQ